MQNWPSITPMYLKIIHDLKREEEKTLAFIFNTLAIKLEQCSQYPDRVSLIQSMLNQQLAKQKLGFEKRVRDYLWKYKRQLSLLYVFLANEGGIRLVDLPYLISDVIEKHQNIQQDQTILIYIISSLFIPIVVSISDKNSIQYKFQLANPQSLCYTLSFADLQGTYSTEKIFLLEILSRSLRIIKNIPTLSSYDFYQQIPLSDILDIKKCLFSSSLIDTSSTNLIEQFNCAKIVNFTQIIKQRPISNNSLLNLIDRLNIQKILSVPNHKQFSNQIKHFCLTFAVTKRHYWKLRLFFEKIPPQMAPYTKYDVLSYAKGEEHRTIFYRFATENYWEHCPQSEFLEVYYLCNSSQIQWISIPANQYGKKGNKIVFWTPQQINNLYRSNENIFRGVQKKGQFVIIGAGNEYFWRVGHNKGLGVLLKWSVLLKQYSQLVKYIEIVKQHQKSQIHTSNLLNYPHRRIIFNYLSHEFPNLDSQILQILISFLRSSLRKEQNCYSSLCSIYKNQSLMIKRIISDKYRICGLCGRQIINMYAYAKQNIICLLCVPQQIPNEDPSCRFELSYMCKPSKFQQYFKNIQSSREVENQQQVNPINLNRSLENIFCQGSFLGSYQISYCSGEAIKDTQNYSNHCTHFLQNLSMHIFFKRAYFCTIQSAVKVYACKLQKNISETSQMKSALTFLTQCCLTPSQKSQVSSQICHYFKQNNYVLFTLNLLSSKSIS